MTQLDRRRFGPLAYEVPSYATYPTSDWFVEAFGSAEVSDWFAASQTLEPAHLPSLAVSVPPGATVALGSQAWLTAFGRETALYADQMVRNRAIGEVHWTLGRDSMPANWLEALLDVLACGFYLGANPRLTVALDPLAQQVLPQLVALGFSRVDIGCGQADSHALRGPAAPGDCAWGDWHERVLGHAASVRGDPRVSVGLGLCYGAPDQTIGALERWLDDLLACAPGRIQVRHADSMRHDIRSQEGGAALPQERLPMLRVIAARLAEAGYSQVASDYYALPDDAFGVAQRRGCLVMRPYGPCVSAGHTTIALGPASIGLVGPVYYQNHRADSDYVTLLARGELPIMRGVGLSAADLVRRTVIHSFSCNLFVDVDALNLAYGIDFDRHFAAELPMLEQLERAGMISRTAGTIEIVGDGLLLVDHVCMVFDAHLHRHRSSKPYLAPL